LPFTSKIVVFLPFIVKVTSGRSGLLIVGSIVTVCVNVTVVALGS
jgi:hypothetical protein